MLVTSPLGLAGAGPSAPPPGGHPVVPDLLDVALGHLHALAVEREGQLPGGCPGAESGQALELVRAEPGQVRLDLPALGRLGLVEGAVAPHSRLSVLRNLRRCPTGVLPVEGRRPVRARTIARRPRR